ncbi:alpha-amylase family glycosyl hydrolase, partial [Burkholderia sp. SIMBA_042]|uniref:alpha-amylase family glycosyl hydrolase n=1 Tax=Burkholderia sp. SIMBA_042 TaxID=3085783 RepID=UPI00397DF707
ACRSRPPDAAGGTSGRNERRLPALAALGVTAIELMPINASPGARNWGYDGVLPFAPDASYGRHEELKALIDAAHGLGLQV